MTSKTITERQHYWLNHIRAVDAGSESTVDYAQSHGLKVKDLYQWKTKLIKLGFYDADHSVSEFVPVKTLAPPVPDLSTGSSQCALVFPSGLRFEFGESISPEVIRAVIASASEHG